MYYEGDISGTAIAASSTTYCLVGRVFHIASGGYRTVAFTSLDGVTWVASDISGVYDPNFGDAGFSVAHNGQVFCVTAKGGLCVTSSDGVAWSTPTRLPFAALPRYNSLVVVNGVFCQTSNAASDVALLSNDGVTWVKSTLPSTNYWGIVMANETDFFSVSVDINGNPTTAAATMRDVYPMVQSSASTHLILATGQGYGWAAGYSVQCTISQVQASGKAYSLSIASATAPRILAAAQGYSGGVGASGVTCPLIQSEGAAPQEVLGQSVTVRVSLILARGTAQQVSTPLGGIAMHTERQALTTYSNFPFNSFALFNGVYLAAGDGGLFALAGATDDGAFIDAAARVGITDFGTSHLKRVDRMYVGYRTDGDLVLRVFTDEVTVRDYALKASGASGLHGNHVRIGKGVQARYWQFEIRNTNGSDFELNMIEVKPQVLHRRVGGSDA